MTRNGHSFAMGACNNPRPGIGESYASDGRRIKEGIPDPSRAEDQNKLRILRQRSRDGRKQPPKNPEEGHGDSMDQSLPHGPVTMAEQQTLGSAMSLECFVLETCGGEGDSADDLQVRAAFYQLLRSTQGIPLPAHQLPNPLCRDTFKDTEGDFFAAMASAVNDWRVMLRAVFLPDSEFLQKSHLEFSRESPWGSPDPQLPGLWELAW